MPYDRLSTGNGITIKEAVKSYKQGFEARGSKIRVISATKTQIHYEVVVFRGKKIPSNHPLQKENFSNSKYDARRKRAEKKLGLFGA